METTELARDNKIKPTGKKKPVEVLGMGTKSTTLPLTEFCMRLSETDKRVELISGFEATERQAGRVLNTVDGFSAAYLAFINTPA